LRASAHKGEWGGEAVRRISLGDKNQEQFQQYLLGEEDFPSNARLFLHIFSEEIVSQVAVFPCTSRVEASYRHKFYIPGFLFILFLDGTALRSLSGTH